MISSSQRPLSDNTQHSQQTNIHVLRGIRTHNLSRPAAVYLHFRPRGKRDRLLLSNREWISDKRLSLKSIIIQDIWIINTHTSRQKHLVRLFRMTNQDLTTKAKVKAVCGSYSTAALRHIVLLAEWVPSFISRGAAHTKRRERPLLAKEGTIPGSIIHVNLQVLLHAAKLGHGTDSFTSPPEEGMLRIFTPVKIQRFRQDLNPQTWVPETSKLTTRPPKPSTWQQTTNTQKKTNIYAPGGIRTRDPNNREAAAPYLRPSGHQEQLKFVSGEAFIASLYQ